jgi:hypothetical protein
MSNIKQLKDFIEERGYVTYDQAKERAYEIDDTWRVDTWTRGLRNAKDIKQVYKFPNKNPGGSNAVIGYKYRPAIFSGMWDVSDSFKQRELCLK